MYKTKDGRWRSVLTVGYRPDGKPLRKYFTGRTQADVKAKLLLHKQRTAVGEVPEPNRETVQTFLTRWIESHIAPRRAEATTALYRCVLERHVYPRIGGVAMQKLSPAIIQQFSDTLLTSGTPSRMAELAFDVLVRGLRHAHKLRVIDQLPSVGIAAPTHEGREIFPFNATEAAELLEVSRGSRTHLPVALGLAMGLRVGEILGLRWECVDLSQRTIHVCLQASEVEGRITLKKPKTRTGIRTVQMPDIVVQAVQEHRAIMLREGHAAHEMVCPSPDGRLGRRTNFTRREWLPLQVAAKLAPRGFHHTRHTYATLALGGGVPVHVVSRVMGHSKPSITLDIYAHLLSGQQDQATAAINRLFG